MKQSLWITVLFAVLCLSALTLFSYATPPSHAQTAGALSLIRHFEGRINTLFIEGNIAYAGAGGTLAVLDISSPENPIIIGKSEPIPGALMEIAVVDSIAYVANWKNGLVTIDVSDPTNPRVLDSVQAGRYTTNDIAISGSTAYLTAWGYGLMSVDVSDSNDLVVLDTIDFEYAGDVQVVGDAAYIERSVPGQVGLRELLMIDVSDPANLEWKGAVLKNESPSYIHIADTIVYFTNEENELVTVDVNNPEMPIVLSRFDLMEGVSTVKVIDGVAYISGGADMLMIDVSDPANPTKLDSFRKNVLGGNGVTFVTAANGIAYLVMSAGDTGLLLVDVSDPADARPIKQVPDIGFIDEFTVSEDGVAYFATWNKGLVVKDVSEALTTLGQIDWRPIGILSYDVAYKDGVVYQAHSSGLSVIDVTDHDNLNLLSYVRMGDIYDLTVVDNLVYAASADGFVIFDVSDPTDPTWLGAISEFPRTTNGFGGEIPIDVAVDGNIAYVSLGSEGIATVDVSDPTNPMLLASLPASDLSVRVIPAGEIAYVLGSQQCLKAVDVSDPANPVVLGSIINAWCTDMGVIGDMAFVAADGATGLMTIDVSDPRNMVLVDTNVTAGVSHIEIIDDVIYAAGGGGTVYVYEYVPPPSLDEDEIVGRIFLPIISH